MKEFIEPIKDQYDFIFIDCLPSLGIITVNSLTAADSVIIPVQAEIFSLEGLGKLKNTINLVKKQLNPELIIEGIVLTMYDKRLRLANLVIEEVKNIQKTVFSTLLCIEIQGSARLRLHINLSSCMMQGAKEQSTSSTLPTNF